MSTEEIKRIEAALLGVQLEIAVLKTWMKVLGFVAAIVVPSVWAIVFAAIVNPRITTLLSAFIFSLNPFA